MSMKEEDDEDKLFLDILGITSVNPEDIERDVLAEAKNDDVGESSEAGESTKGEVLDKLKLYSKLRAIEYEISAVSSTFANVKNALADREYVPDGHIKEEEADPDYDKFTIQAANNDLSLQHVLAADRLQSLEKAKAQVQKELRDLCKDESSEDVEQHKLIQSIVATKQKSKRQLEGVQKSGKDVSKQQKTVDKRHKTVGDDVDFDAMLDASSSGFMETERDELVRKGILTPFSKLEGYERRIQQTGLLSQGQNASQEPENEEARVAKAIKSFSEASQARPSTMLVDPSSLPKLDAPTYPFQRLSKPLKITHSSENGSELSRGSKRKSRRPLPGKKWRKKISWEENLVEADGGEDSSSGEAHEGAEGIHKDDEPSCVTLEGGLKIPEVIFSKLFDYQKVGVQWLWELHCQRAGGIIGDEMGLGKTIQVLSFLGALHFSNMYKPSIIVCPVTLLRQWKREARKWYPKFHVELLHDSALEPANGKKQSNHSESDYDTEGSLESDGDRKLCSKKAKRWDSMINRVLRSKSGLLITTYEQLRLLGDQLLNIEWGYAVLDEGHRIRNPNTEVTLVCKQLQTVHRIIMTGAPIQNKLTELWSLFDFVFPGKLGVLPVFEAEFAVPISVGGYANASPLQVSTAYRCAVVLRDLIMPYLLRRMKADVNAQLPKKTEHVLFCSLTKEQRSAYQAFLASSDVEQILDGNRNSLYGIDIMRKICNHPDLLEREHSCQNPDYGNPERSGKLKVVSEVLKVWKEQGHRVLLFAQTQQMLDILENFMVTSGYSYRRMDGLTAVKQRMTLIDEFNASDDVFVFILTTKVGGLGTNLTGANRVIIFDPDWNPSTDMQARERAWRIGQKRDVTIYRLITRGTIEEKVYHRQIYKHFLTNKILKNPQQRRFFKARDMKDLFTLNDDGDSRSTETSNLFGQLSEEVEVVGANKENHVKKKTCEVADANADAALLGEENNLGSHSSKAKGKEKIDKGNSDVDEETNILKNLFDANGIHSVMNHDAIMNAHDEEKMRLEEQASQVAQRAAEALRRSRMLRSRESVSVPTWTGKAGVAGAPSSVRQKFGSTSNSQLVSNARTLHESSKNEAQSSTVAGVSVGKALSSAELLARVRGNQERAVADGLEHQFGVASSSGSGTRSTSSWSTQSATSVQPEVLIRQICSFVQQRGGRTTSAPIVEHFKDRIPSKDLPLFKNLLKEIATLQKDPNGSFWVLKPEYR